VQGFELFQNRVAVVPAGQDIAQFGEGWWLMLGASDCMDKSSCYAILNREPNRAFPEGDFLAVPTEAGVSGVPCPRCPAGEDQKRAAFGVGSRGDTSLVEDASCKEIAAENLPTIWSAIVSQEEE
jgi:hypothetical protein